MNNKNGKQAKIISYLFCIGMLCVYYIGYNSSLTLFVDTYGLSNGIAEQKVFYDFYGMVDYIYIGIANVLLMFMGEKTSVLIGAHIICGFISFLLVYFAVKKFERPYLTYIISACFVIVPFWLCNMIAYDGFVLIALAFAFLFFVVIQIIFAVSKRTSAAGNSSFETLSQRELRESQKPKTIVNDRGETIQLIANPLPGPKKHVKRTLDYDYDIPQDKMYFDIDSDTLKDYELK